MLAVGLVCNALVRPVHERFAMPAAEVEALQPEGAAAAEAVPARIDAALVLAWLAVGLPIAWGMWMTLKTAFVLFR
jgi:hypothetical protein